MIEREKIMCPFLLRPHPLTPPLPLPTIASLGYVRDVEAGGFDPSLETASADAVFLDLPGPWKAVPSAAACLRPDGVLCAFSPCIEQVQATAAALAGNGFVGISTQELLLREYEVRRQRLVGGGEGWEKRLEVGGGVEAAAAAAQPAPAVPTAVHPQVVAWPVAEARGHTGYLTFARRAA
jgi:tRNA (adenine57-N1/adenine58-N1)-methyltransferase